jgi:hypothetical protein
MVNSASVEENRARGGSAGASTRRRQSGEGLLHCVHA